jgi:hypothetical protein
MVDDVISDGSPPGHMEKMLGMSGSGDPAPAETPAVAQRPDDVPEKFWDAEKGEVNTAALLKAQADAEAALRRTQQADNEGTPDPNEGKETPADTPTEGNQGSVVDAASAEWAQNGELSEDTYANLEKVGLSRGMVQTYIDGQVAAVEKLRSSAFEPFGGEEQYTEATKWAAESLNVDEIRALDVQLTSNNPAIVAQGAKALLARFEKDGDREPDAIRGAGNGAGVGGTYKSSREMMTDMNSAKYRTDEGFRREVAEKLARSNL